MFCTGCGAPNRAEARFCGSCGRQLTASAPAMADSREPAPSFPVRPSAAPIRRAATAASKVPAVAGYLVMLWGAAILVLALTEDGPALSTLAAMAVFITYGECLVERHQAAVWLGWLIVGVVGIGVIVNGLVPLQIVLWVTLAAWATYVQRQSPSWKLAAARRAGGLHVL